MDNNLSSSYTPTLKTGKENLTYNGSQLPFSLLDFWKWSVSDLLSNATRGVLAEFIVACALGIDITKPREEWASYDLITKDAVKIEVKSAAYLQSWNQKNYSKISFSIKKSFQWDSTKGMDMSIKQRAADIYVFCLLKNKDKNTIDPLNLSQWDFYVVSTEQLDNYERSEHSITLNSLKRLTKAVDYKQIVNEIEYYLKVD
jgi:hypothetical protein